MSRPMNYQFEQYLQTVNMVPYEVKGVYNYETDHNKRYLYNLLYSVFDLGIPDNWDLGYYRYFLFHCGSEGIFYTKQFGWVPMPYAIEKTDFFFKPLVMKGINSHLNQEITGIRGINCELIYILDDLFGLDATVTNYAAKLANLEKAFDVNVMNSSFALTAAVESDKEAREIETAYSKATMGHPFIPVFKNLFKNGRPAPFVENAKQNFAANEIHQAWRAIINDFLTEVGVRNANYEKKERLNSQEVNENNDQTSAQARIILRNLNDCFKRVEAVTDGAVKLTAELNYNYEFADEPQGGEVNDE